MRMLLVVTLFASLSCNYQETSKSGNKEITIPELKSHVSYLASDELEGRGTGSVGYLKAVKYVSDLFKSYGLLPLNGIDSDENPYLQNVPLWKIKGQDDNRLSITVDGTTHQLKSAEDSFLINPTTFHHMAVLEGEPIYVGNGIYEPDHGWNDFNGIDLQGKIAVIRLGIPIDREGNHLLPDEQSRFYSDMNGGGPERILQNIVDRKAKALIIIPNDFLIQNWRFLRNSYLNAVLDQRGYEGHQNEPNLPMLVLNYEASKYLLSQLTSDPLQTNVIQHRGVIPKVKISLEARLEWEPLNSPNVVGIVPGTDRELNEQYIVVGAHLDHLGVMNGQIFNGAVDNATGSAVILEVAQAVAANPLPRPVVFILFSSEEVGHFGSLHFVNHGPLATDKIMAHINVDHAGRDNPYFDDIYAAGLKRIDPRLDGIVKRANERAKVLLHFDDNIPEQQYRGSDHYSFDQAGIPSVVFGTGMFEGYHTPEDDEEFVEYKFTYDIAKIALETIVELANLDMPLSHRSTADR